MKAAVVEAVGRPFEIVELEIDDPIGREVLVEVRASGLCHSDLHIATKDYGYPMPIVLGHELAGVVVAVGPEVTDLEIGDHVVGSLIQFCGRCDACLSGRTHQCLHGASLYRAPGQGERLRRDGVGVFPGMGLGAFAEYSLVHEHQLVRIPDEVPLPQAAILGCGVITGVGAALNSAPVRAGDTVVVIGVGGVGLNVVSGARLAGARAIVAVDVKPAKLELARKFGATHVIDASAEDAVAALARIHPDGVDHAFEVVGSPATTYQAMKMARLGGTVYLIGLHPPGSAIELVDVFPNLIMRQLRIQAVNMGSTNLRRDIGLYADLYLQGRLELDALVASEIALDDINEAYAELANGLAARAVITRFRD
jgi:S-(hydroxymethyl)glutathione dehydrogenase/alcohol dehydrogenase